MRRGMEQDHHVEGVAFDEGHVEEPTLHEVLEGLIHVEAYVHRRQGDRDRL